MSNDNTAANSPGIFLVPLRRAFHMLALIQHSTEEEWNSKTLADALSLLPGEKPLASKAITACIRHLKEMGIPLNVCKGARRISLARELTEDEILEILAFYRVIAVDEDASIGDSFRVYVRNAGSRALWIIGRVYFAAIERREIRLTYRSEHRGSSAEYDIRPVRWVFRDNAVYLAAIAPERGMSLFRLTRIIDIAVLDRRFDDTADTSGAILHDSLGAFISDRVHRITLEYPSHLHHRILEEFGRIELEFSDPESDIRRVSFSASDLITLCRTVFPFGGDVVIVEPVEAINEMKRLLEGNREKYR